MTIGLTWRRTARRIKRLKEAVLTISPDYSIARPPTFWRSPQRRVLTTWNRKPPLRSSSWQTIAFLEQSDELTLAEYRSSTTPTHAGKLRDRSMTTHFVPL